VVSYGRGLLDVRGGRAGRFARRRARPERTLARQAEVSATVEGSAGRISSAQMEWAKLQLGGVRS
ncbi:MAG TPA: hypothetical protein VNZ53_08115, partial [Steroidobacteraceae bacterium]|nr:hypothetical protein [Steroidobacteraceae bacterium]